MTENKNVKQKRISKEDVSIIIEIFKTHKAEINQKANQYGKHTHYLLALISFFLTILALYIQNRNTFQVFIDLIKDNWIFFYIIVFGFHLVALYLAAEIASEFFFIMINSHVLKNYESLVSKYLSKEVELIWERYWVPDFLFKPFPFRSKLVLNPNYFAAITIILLVFILNVGTMYILYEVNKNWFYVMFLIPILWIYKIIIFTYLEFGWYKWKKREKQKEPNLALDDQM